MPRFKNHFLSTYFSSFPCKIILSKNILEKAKSPKFIIVRIPNTNI